MDVDWGWLVAFKLDTTPSIDHSQQCCFMLFHVAFLKCLLLCNVNHHHEPFEKYLWATCFQNRKVIRQETQKLHLQDIPRQMTTLEELNFVEFYAGVGNVWQAVSESGYPAARVDVQYHETPSNHLKQNPMDILSSAGFANFGCTNPNMVYVNFNITRNQSLCGIDVANENHVDQGKILQYREMF